MCFRWILWLALSCSLLAEDRATVEIQELKNIDYVGNANPRQMLDVIVPRDQATVKRPLIVFIHGGAWLGGEKENGTEIVQHLAKTGNYVTATINYRLSQEAIWPAQIHDCKAAIRFLRGNADKYGIDPDRIGVMGISAGGHLSSMLGTCDHPALEGNEGAFTAQKSSVQCVVNFFGPSNFQTFFGEGVPFLSKWRNYEGLRVLGKTDDEVQKNSIQASPVTWVSKGDAPFLTAHGTKDEIVPYTQAVELDEKLKKAGVESYLITVREGGHGFYSDDLNDRISRFLGRHLRDQPSQISTEPIQLR